MTGIFTANLNHFFIILAYVKHGFISVKIKCLHTKTPIRNKLFTCQFDLVSNAYI